MSTMAEYFDAFFEESIELLDEMEECLLTLNPEQIEPEQVDSIFRTAHSIKGGSATLNIQEICELTHVAETFLDEVRDNKRGLTAECVDLLLSTVDCIRQMIANLQDNQAIDTTDSKQFIIKYNQLLGEKETSESSQPSGDEINNLSDDELESMFETIAADRAQSLLEIYQIGFVPAKNLFELRSDPSLLIGELMKLGQVNVTANLDQLPKFSQLEVSSCYLSWDFVLETDAEKDEIEEIFEWISDLCDIKINKISKSKPEQENPDSGSTTNPVINKLIKPANAKTTDETKTATKQNAEGASIRVAIDKVEALMNMVGELVITQSMLSQISSEFDSKTISRFRAGLSQLEQNSREIQENVMRIRMLPISNVFNRFHRVVRDNAKKLDKKIDLKISGESTEIDKTVMEKISDPLVHLIRNSIDHGIESAEQRLAIGKPEVGIIHLNAFHQGSSIIIEILDDGAGLPKDKILEKAIKNGIASDADQLSDSEIYDLIFQPGFSTAEAVTDISGRGVGMDVVRRNITALNGTIEIETTPGHGSTMRIRLPLTLAILDGQLVKIGNQVFIIPLISIVEITKINRDLVKTIGGNSEVYMLREQYVPIIRLYDIMSIEPTSTNLEDGFLIIVDANNTLYGFFIDELLSHQQIVIKNMEENFRKITGVSGATILGDGTVSLIIDVPGLSGLATSLRISANRTTAA